MFYENKYTKWYFNIVENAKDRNNADYIEKHHVIPRCIGGADDDANIIALTAREHFICHLLLTKMHKSNKLKYALIMMTVKNPHQTDRYIPNSKIYESIKRNNAELAKEKFKGKQKHNVGKKCAYDPVTLIAKMFLNLDDIPKDWVLGSSPKRRENQLGKNKDKIYYYHPDTCDIIAINDDAAPPEGYIKGNPNAATRTSTGTKMFYDENTMEVKRFLDTETVPKNWIQGSPYVWATNGLANMQILKNQILPKGFYYGRTSSKSN